MICFDKELFSKYAEAVFTTDSPSGYTANVVNLLAGYIRDMGYEYRIHNKGTLEVMVPGADESKTVATSAHADTL